MKQIKKRTYSHLKMLFIPKDGERLIEKFVEQCKAEGISFSAKVNQLINEYMMKGKGL